MVLPCCLLFRSCMAAKFETSEKLRIVKTANVMAMTIQVINVVLKKLFDLVIV